MASSEHFVNQPSIRRTNASHAVEDWNDMAQTPADMTPLRTGLLHNANNNASSGPWRGLRSPTLSSSASHSKLSYLECVVLEIVESERMYVRDLRSIVENYLGKIIDTQELLLRPEQVSALFGNIEDIYELNSELLQDLDSCHNDPVAVARCFVDRSQDFDIYTQYCNNYPNSVAALTECMRNKQLAKFFRERQEQIRHSLPLGSYLLKPVQRILKYHLLLQEIAKHFDIEEDGYEVVEEAIDTMTCVAWYINDMKRKHEHAVRLQEIQSLLINWKGPDLTTYGELVLEGTFRVHRVKNERTFFLFDKMLLITKKRGDHYVYKSHIPCSSLMLIESTRDSLWFTITHYKHNKQQYNIQAKSGEEKRVWTHHIKRLILENHHAIIPQKAKEAILEMDSFYPPRYKYSPERLKKSWLGQPTEEVPQHGRQGRRQSEPFHGKMSTQKRLEEQHSSATAGIKGRRKSEPTKQILKQLSNRGLKHADSDGALLEFGETPQAPNNLSPEEEEEEEDQQILPQEDSPEDLAESDGSEKETGPEEEEEAEEEEEERLGKGHRVQEGPRKCPSSGRSERNAIMETGSSFPKARSAMELSRVLEASSQKEECLEESPSDPESTGPLMPILAKQEEAANKGPNSLKTSENSGELKPISSEEEEEEEEDSHVPQPRSILPVSVLDQASIIAERFANSLSRRSSLAFEEGKGHLTPKLASRSSSVLSLEGSEKPAPNHKGSTNDPASPLLLPQETSAEASSSCGQVALPGVVELDHHPSSCRRRESLLSQQDRQLLDKIKNYYDYAEHQDAGFSVRRRESLSYIPKGLVRNSVFRINSLPQSEPGTEALQKKRLGSTSGGSEVGRTAAWVMSSRPGVRSQANSSEAAFEGSPVPITEAEFRPPTEMVKVWEEMEKPRRALWSRWAEDAGTKSSKVNGAVTGGVSRWHTEPSPKGRLRGQENGLEPLLILEDGDLGDIMEESAAPSPESKVPLERAVPSRLLWKTVQELRSCEPEQSSLSQMHLDHLTEAELTEKVKNKVYQLARQYSLRIKGHKPASHRQLAEVEEEMKKKGNPVPGQQEERKQDKGKEKPALNLLNYEQVVLQGTSPLSQVSSSHEKSPKCFSFSPCSSSPRLTSPSSTLSCSPLTPIVVEKFSWPDVRELRSKYSCPAEVEKRRPKPVNRSCSAPEKMVDADRVLEQFPCPKRNAKARLRSHQEDMQSCEKEAFLNSLSKDHACNAQKELCITAKASLENSQRVIVMEKLLDTTGEPDESYVQIRSPTSREKISLKAVVERCKAYQDSEEYRRREEDVQEGAPRKALQQDRLDRPASNHQNLVKNLREKFLTSNSNT